MAWIHRKVGTSGFVAVDGPCVIEVRVNTENEKGDERINVYASPAAGTLVGITNKSKVKHPVTDVNSLTVRNFIHDIRGIKKTMSNQDVLGFQFIALAQQAYKGLVSFRESDSRLPGKTFWDPLAEIKKTWRNDAVPQILRGDFSNRFERIVIAIEEFDLQDEAVEPYIVYSELEQLINAIAEFESYLSTPYVIESVQSLAMQPDVTHYQIAKMYGWTTPNGSPDAGKVAAEIQSPGSQTKNYLHPKEQARRKSKKIWDAGKKEFEKALSNGELNPKNEDRQPCKESWEELAADQFVSPEQAAKMKLVSVEEATTRLQEIRAAGQTSANTTPDPAADLKAIAECTDEYLDSLKKESLITLASRENISVQRSDRVEQIVKKIRFFRDKQAA